MHCNTTQDTNYEEQMDLSYVQIQHEEGIYIPVDPLLSKTRLIVLKHEHLKGTTTQVLHVRISELCGCVEPADEGWAKHKYRKTNEKLSIHLG